MKRRTLLIILILLASCKSKQKITEFKKETRDSVTTVKEKALVSKPLLNTSKFDINKYKALDETFQFGDLRVSIEKDSASNTLKVTKEAKSDTVFVEKEVKTVVNDTIISEKENIKKVFIPNPLNWKIPIIFIIVIVVILYIKW